MLSLSFLALLFSLFLLLSLNCFFSAVFVILTVIVIFSVLFSLFLLLSLFFFGIVFVILTVIVVFRYCCSHYCCSHFSFILVS